MTSEPQAPNLEVRRSVDRDQTRLDWLDSKHSFSFGTDFERSNLHYGLLLVNNDDTVVAGRGFDTHPHRNMEIVTWVVQGALVHQDSQGHSGVIYPGLAQRMTAGTGILHSEKNDPWRLSGGEEHSDPVRFIQMWLPPDEQNVEPGYEQLEIDNELMTGNLVVVASGMPAHEAESAIRIHNRFAALHVARLRNGQSIELPDAPYVHLFVAKGGISLEGAGDLHEGDAARITGGGGQRVTARCPAEVLAWEMHANLG